MGALLMATSARKDEVEYSRDVRVPAVVLTEDDSSKRLHFRFDQHSGAEDEDPNTPFWADLELQLSARHAAEGLQPEGDPPWVVVETTQGPPATPGAGGGSAGVAFLEFSELTFHVELSRQGAAELELMLMRAPTGADVTTTVDIEARLSAIQPTGSRSAGERELPWDVSVEIDP
jgi:hypothetical protein